MASSRFPFAEIVDPGFASTSSHEAVELAANHRVKAPPRAADEPAASQILFAGRRIEGAFPRRRESIRP